MDLFDDEEELLIHRADITDATQDYNPTLSDLTRYFKNARIPQDDGSVKFMPLVGEESTVLVAFLGHVLGGASIIVKAGAGTGKTVISNMVMSLMPEDMYFRVDMLSGLGIYAEHQAVNAARYVIASELQNSGTNDEVIKVLKLWGEGRRAERSRTDVTQRDESGNFGTVNVVLQCKPFLSSFAIENETARGLYNEEMARRVIELPTDSSQEQTTKIAQMQLRLMEVGKEGICDMDDDEVDLLRAHVEYCILKADEIRAVRFPGAGAMIDGIPTTFVETRSTISLLEKVMRGIAIWNIKNRVVTDDGILLMTPTDLEDAWRIFGRLFVIKSLHVEPIAEPILQVLPEPVYANERIADASTLDLNQIIAALKEIGVNVSKKKATMMLENLIDNNLVEIDTSSIMEDKRYYKTPMSIFDGTFDIEAVKERSIQVVMESYPEYLDAYREAM